MKKAGILCVFTLLVFASCSSERQVYNTSDHGYRHGRKTRYYREYRGYAHRGDFNKGYNNPAWEYR